MLLKKKQNMYVIYVHISLVSTVSLSSIGFDLIVKTLQIKLNYFNLQCPIDTLNCLFFFVLKVSQINLNRFCSLLENKSITKIIEIDPNADRVLQTSLAACCASVALVQPLHTIHVCVNFGPLAVLWSVYWNRKQPVL